METLQTSTMPLMHVYHLTYDGVNTGITLEEVSKLIEEHGPDHQIEITITTTTPDPEVPTEPQVSNIWQNS